MALLEQIEKMKQEGKSEANIAMTLKEQGYPLTQINEAISQSKIKSAVYGNPNQQSDELQPSIMQANPGDVTAPAQGQNQQQYADQNYQQQAYSQDQNYAGGQDVYYTQALDVETVRDIAKQETEEAIKKIRQDVDTLNKMKTDMKFEIQNIDNRLTRIESIIQELQSAIIRKMGEYGEAISGISEDLQATQNTFSKMINPILDKTREEPESQNQEIEPRQERKEVPVKKVPGKPQKGKEDSASFEDYFR